MYSQNNEQTIITEFFRNQNGTVLDIGANDGITFSNSLALIEAGWSATLVEPSPKAFAKLYELHHANQNVEMLNLAIGLQNGKIILHESGAHVISGADVALVSSIKEEETKKWRDAGVFFAPKEVEMVTWKEFLKMINFNKFDCITMDVEGAEMDILPQIDLNKVACKLICIEWNSIPQNKVNFDSVILPQGFECIHSNPENLIYVKK